MLCLLGEAALMPLHRVRLSTFAHKKAEFPRKRGVGLHYTSVFEVRRCLKSSVGLGREREAEGTEQQGDVLLWLDGSLARQKPSSPSMPHCSMPSQTSPHSRAFRTVRRSMRMRTTCPSSVSDVHVLHHAPVQVDLAVLESLCGSKKHAGIISHPARLSKGAGLHYTVFRNDISQHPAPKP